MIRKIICIDREKCNGCGACAAACHEGAIDMIDGKAVLVRESFCDGLGDCLPECPAGAITFEEREAPAYDAAAVKARQTEQHAHAGGGCPGSRMLQMEREHAPESARACPRTSELRQWPVQIRLLPAKAPFFSGADLLIAADCCAYTYAAFHEDYMRGRVTLIGCPKLDDEDYTERLSEIFRENDVRSVTVVRMEVPCCGGLQLAAQLATRASGKFIPFQVVTLSRDGRVIG